MENLGIVCLGGGGFYRVLDFSKYVKELGYEPWNSSAQRHLRFEIPIADAILSSDQAATTAVGILPTSNGLKMLKEQYLLGFTYGFNEENIWVKFYKKPKYN